MDFVRATSSHLDEVEMLVRDCTTTLTAQGILQWDEGYPNRAFFETAIAAQELYLLLDADQIAGIVVLDEWQSPQWQQIAWERPGTRILVVHAFAIAPAMQGKGYGDVLLHHCESYAREQGYTYVRFDAFDGNNVACRFYEQRGYLYRGAVEFASKQPGHERYRCYEKRVA